MLPLEGCRVLDFGWVWSAPATGAILADLGAEVIRVESRSRLEPNRLRSHDQDKADLGYEAFSLYRNLNRGKESVTLDLKQPQGLDLVRRLAARSDIVLENFSPGVLDRLGLGYEPLRKENPRLIMLSMSAVGQDGPYGEMRAYAPCLTSLGGLESLVGYPGEEPIGMLTFGYADPNSATWGALAALSALFQVRRTGVGMHLDLSQMECAAAVGLTAMAECQESGLVPGPLGSRDLLMAPHGHFPCKGEDNWVAIAVRPEQWESFCRAAGHLEWTADPRLAAFEARQRHIDYLEGLVAGWTATLSAAAAAGLLTGAGIAASPVRTMAEVLADPDLRGRGVLQPAPHPLLGAEEVFATPWRFPEASIRVRRHAPLLGEHTDSVLRRVLGLTQAEVEEFRQSGALT